MSGNSPFKAELNRYGRELLKFDGRDFKKLLGPGIYAAVSGDEFLYVGSSNCLLGRLSDTKHESLRKALQVEGCEVWVIIAASEAQARHLESWLIAEHQPRFNKVGKRGCAYRSLAETYENFDSNGATAIIQAESPTSK